MSKVYLIILISIVLQSCAIVRTKRVRENSGVDRESKNLLVNRVISNNIGDNDFTSKFRSTYSSGSDSKSFTGFLKCKSNGDMLISVRSVAGIEVARAFIDSDSIKIGDRINRILYIQSVDYIMGKFGLSKEFIGLLWGDIPADVVGEAKIIRGSESVNVVIEERNVTYDMRLDRDEEKLSDVVGLVNSLVQVRVSYFDFKNIDSLIYPALITLEVIDDDLEVEIEIKKVDPGIIKSMNFPVRRDYKTVILK